jgi:hypothetical protein
MWAAGSPETLFNVGLISVLVLMVLMKATVKLSGSSGFVNVWIGGGRWFLLPQRRQKGIDLEQQGSVYGVGRGEMR